MAPQVAAESDLETIRNMVHTGKVSVRLVENGIISAGRAADPDVIVASVRAYMGALNRSVQKENERRV